MRKVMRSIRVNRELWNSAMQKAKQEGITLTEAIENFLREYIQSQEVK